MAPPSERPQSTTDSTNHNRNANTDTTIAGTTTATTKTTQDGTQHISVAATTSSSDGSTENVATTTHHTSLPVVRREKVIGSDGKPSWKKITTVVYPDGRTEINTEYEIDGGCDVGAKGTTADDGGLGQVEEGNGESTDAVPELEVIEDASPSSATKPMAGGPEINTDDAAPIPPIQAYSCHEAPDAIDDEKKNRSKKIKRIGPEINTDDAAPLPLANAFEKADSENEKGPGIKSNVAQKKNLETNDSLPPFPEQVQSDDGPPLPLSHFEGADNNDEEKFKMKLATGTSVSPTTTSSTTQQNSQYQNDEGVGQCNEEVSSTDRQQTGNIGSSSPFVCHAQQPPLHSAVTENSTQQSGASQQTSQSRIRSIRSSSSSEPMFFPVEATLVEEYDKEEEAADSQPISNQQSNQHPPQNEQSDEQRRPSVPVYEAVRIPDPSSQPWYKRHQLRILIGTNILFCIMAIISLMFALSQSEALTATSVPTQTPTTVIFDGTFPYGTFAPTLSRAPSPNPVPTMSPAPTSLIFDEIYHYGSYVPTLSKVPSPMPVPTVSPAPTLLLWNPPYGEMPPETPDDSSSGINTNAILIGVTVGLFLIVFVCDVVYCIRKRRRQRMECDEERGN